MLTIMSLFDGIGGFPLSGVMAGMKPVYASEIEKYPMAVSAARFPDMIQLGSVTDIDGAAVEPVDIITFGSPCQDLSVAGKQKGIHDGERSNLFFEAIRIIKEMRNADEANGRTGKHIRPRFAVWENVPGAFSSNKGEDFRAVLEAFASVCENDISIPRPKKWNTGGGMAGHGWSLAWRVYDAQYWGVPQRRKRIYLVADFGSERAGEILFVEQGLRGDSAESRTARQGTAADAERSADGSGGVKCLNPWDCQSKRQYDVSGVYRTLDAGESAGGQAHGVVYEPKSLMEENWAERDVKGALRAEPSKSASCVVEPAAFMGGQGAKARSIAYCDDGSTLTLKSAPSGGNTVPDVVYPLNTMVATRGGKDDMRTCFGIGEPGDPQFTLQAAHEHGVVYAMDAVSSNSMKLSNPHSGFHEEQVARTLDTRQDPTCNQGGNVVVQPVYALQGNGIDRADTAGCNGCGWRTDEMYTLNTIDRPAVAFQACGDRDNPNISVSDRAYCLAANPMSDRGQAVCFQQNQRDEVRDMGEQAGALTAQPGAHNQNYLCYPETARTLVARHDSSSCVDRGQNVVAYTAKRFSEYGEGCGTLRASGGDVGGGTESIVVERTLL